MEGVFKCLIIQMKKLIDCLFCSYTIFLNILRAQHAKKNIIMCLNLHFSLFSQRSTMEKHFKIRELEQSNWLWGKSISMYIYYVYIHKIFIQYKKNCDELDSMGEDLTMPIWCRTCKVILYQQAALHYNIYDSSF